MDTSSTTSKGGTPPHPAHRRRRRSYCSGRSGGPCARSSTLPASPVPSAECKVVPPNPTAATPVLAVTSTVRSLSLRMASRIARRAVVLPVPAGPVRNTFIPARTRSSAWSWAGERVSSTPAVIQPPNRLGERHIERSNAHRHLIDVIVDPFSQLPLRHLTL